MTTLTLPAAPRVARDGGLAAPRRRTPAVVLLVLGAVLVIGPVVGGLFGTVASGQQMIDSFEPHLAPDALGRYGEDLDILRRGADAVQDVYRTQRIPILTVRSLRVGVVLAAWVLPLTSLLVTSTGGLGDRDTIASGTATGTVAALLAFGAWGASVAGSEYVHRTIAVSLTLVPRRRDLYVAKLGAVAATTTLAALVSVLVAFVLVRAAAPPGEHALGTPAALSAVVAAVVAVSVVGAAVGIATRAGTASIAIVAAAVLLPQAAAGLLGGLQPWVVGASPGTVVTQVVQGGQLATAETFPGGTALALLTMALVAAVVATGSGIAFLRRDG